MTNKIIERSFTGKESNSDLSEIIENYLNPQKIKNLRFVFVLKGDTGKTQKVDCYQFGGGWIRVNYHGNNRIQTREIDFDDLMKRTLKTMQLPQNLSYSTTVKLTVYGDK